MGFAALSKQLIQNQSSTKYVVFPHTYQVRDYAPALACRMGQVLIGDVVAIEEGPRFVRQLMQGRLTGSYRHFRRWAVLCLSASGSVSSR